MRQTLATLKAKTVETANGCWVWLGATFQRTGYGVVHHEGKSRLVHRVAYLLATGEEPPEVHHICRNRLCCNPQHLQGVTKSEHRRIDHNGFTPNTGQFVRREKCAKGHPIGTTPGGQRLCRECRREWERSRYIPRPSRSTCKRGHAWIAENLYTLPDGRRTCRECARLRYQKWRERRH